MPSRYGSSGFSGPKNACNDTHTDFHHWKRRRRVAFNSAELRYLGAAVARQGFIDLVNVGGHRLKTGIETVKSLLLDLFERLLGSLRPLPGCFKFCGVQSTKQTEINHVILTGHLWTHDKQRGWPSLVSWNLSRTLSSFSMAFMLGALILWRMLCCSFSLCCKVFISPFTSSSASESCRKSSHVTSHTHTSLLTGFDRRTFKSSDRLL